MEYYQDHLVEHYGQPNVPVRVLIKISKELCPWMDHRNGLHVEALKKTARHELFRYRATHLDWGEKEDLEYLVMERHMPVIVDWWQGGPDARSEGHYSVCIGVGPNEITLVDPSYRMYRTMNWDDFERNWMDNRKNTVKSPAHIDGMKYRRMIIVAPSIPRKIPYHSQERKAQRLEAYEHQKEKLERVIKRMKGD
jgi:ABC-type bacteriocin/lantibiotic exporter with double-glycine peptidase domain